MKLGYRIKQKRELNRMSQQEIADYLEVCQKTYSNYESCKTTPSTLHLIKLNKILKFDFIEYLKENEDNNSKPFNSLTQKLKENLINNYEIIIRDKDEIIQLLRDKIKNLKK